MVCQKKEGKTTHIESVEIRTHLCVSINTTIKVTNTFIASSCLVSLFYFAFCSKGTTHEILEFLSAHCVTAEVLNCYKVHLPQILA